MESVQIITVLISLITSEIAEFSPGTFTQLLGKVNVWLIQASMADELSKYISGDAGRAEGKRDGLPSKHTQRHEKLSWRLVPALLLGMRKHCLLGSHTNYKTMWSRPFNSSPLQQGCKGDLNQENLIV